MDATTVEVPRGLDDNLGAYWYHGTIITDNKQYVLAAIESNNKPILRATPQYGFTRGMNEFGDLGYEATRSELDDNLISMGAIKILKRHEVNSDVYKNALSYLMFLKRKRSGKVKARGCADGRPQREYISKEESSSPTVSIC